MRQPKTIYLSLGSNIGDRAAHVAAAVAALAAAGLRVTKQSSLYATEPVDFRAQGWFLNCCLEVETELMPRQLLHAVQKIERSLGRRRMVRFGPRTIDIDILFFGSSRIRAREFQVPHPRIAARRFVLVPLSEIAPSLRHSTLRKTVAELLADCPDRSHVTKYRGQA
jgi:2-amino-4-hydroxy-6-hydroxymethyldihydropteridine diphosphokinase